MQALFYTSEDHALNPNLCVTFVKPLNFTGIQRVKTGLFYKSNSVSFMNRWFIDDVIEH